LERLGVFCRGPVGKGAAIWAGINMASCNGVAIGLGYLPANGVEYINKYIYILYLAYLLRHLIH
jgi:hypothetical protein